MSLGLNEATEILDTTATVNWAPVESQYLEAVSFDSEKSIMLVKCRGGAVYEVLSVTEKEHRALMLAQSKGRHYHTYFGTETGHTKRRLDRAVVFSPRNKQMQVTSPLYLALLQTKKSVVGGSNFQYALWCATGRERKDKANARYTQACVLVTEAGGGKLGPEHLDKAIQLDKQRGV